MSDFWIFYEHTGPILISKPNKKVDKNKAVWDVEVTFEDGFKVTASNRKEAEDAAKKEAQRLYGNLTSHLVIDVYSTIET